MIKCLYKSGRWGVFEVENQDPTDFYVTNGIRRFYNKDKEAAFRLADFLDSADKKLA
jgi:hypothetical protein